MKGVGFDPSISPPSDDDAVFGIVCSVCGDDIVFVLHVHVACCTMGMHVQKGQRLSNYGVTVH